MVGAAVVAGLCGIWRIEQFGHIELQGDQAFFTQWILRLADADHFLPEGVDGHGWLQALMHDEESFLNILLRQIYQAQVLLFILISTIIFTVAAVGVGASMESVVGISITASAIALWLLALFPVMCRATSSKITPAVESYAIGGLVLIGGCASSFFNVFSAMGPHNTGVMFLLMAALVTQRWLCRVSATGLPFADRQAAVLMFVVQWLAIYSHYTNVFIVAPATVVAIALDPSLEPKRRLGIIVKFSGITFLAFVPALALMALYSNALGGPANDQTFAGVAAKFVLSTEHTAGDSIGERAFLWFRDVATIYTAPGLFLGLIGVAGMAWRDRIILPAAIVAVHFFFGTFMQSFGQYDRTAAYLLPMLMLGGAWSVVVVIRYLIEHRHAGWRGTAVGSILAVFVLTAMTRHAFTEYSRIENPSAVLRWGPQAEKIVWRPIISQIDASIPHGGVLIPWSYGLSHQFRSMSERYRRDIRVLRPLETLMSQWDAGTLLQYLDNRGLTMSPGRRTYVLAPGDMTSETLNRNLQRLFGLNGFALSGSPTVVPRLSWKLPSEKFWKVDLRFFEVVWQ